MDQRLADAGLTPAQVQVAWVKQALRNGGDFPEKAETLQAYLEVIARNLLIRYPNIKIAFFSSRTRSYRYWTGLSPEPVAYETGFSVRWMIEKQINGDPSLNYDPANGSVVAPFLSWGPYLWADGTNPRGDGFTWEPEDMLTDCTHPSISGRLKVTDLLLAFFQTDTLSTGWFLEERAITPTVTPPVGATPTPAPPSQSFLPLIEKEISPTGAAAVVEQDNSGNWGRQHPAGSLIFTILVLAGGFGVIVLARQQP